jgi:hypothetical protein
MKLVSNRMTALGASLLMASSTITTPGYANDGQRILGAIGFGFGAVLGGMLSQHGQPGRYNNYRNGSVKPSHPVPANSSPSREVALASLGANKNLDNVLREVTLKSIEASAGSDDSRKFGHKGDVDNVKIDLPTELATFVSIVQTLGSETTAVGDVSMVTVESALNEVYEAPEQDALRQFELLRGANYTAEQFKVEILRESEQKLGRFAKGNSRGLVLISQIKQLFGESARDVYDSTFEIAELSAMNRHLIDFDRELYEKGKSLPTAPAGPVAQPLLNATQASDDDAYPGATSAVNVKAEYDTPSQPGPSEPVSKMRHITAETLRLAEVLADDIPFESTRETREFVQAYRYRLTRATIDCFILIAANNLAGLSADKGVETQSVGAADAASKADALSTNKSADESPDDRYEDLVRRFQASIAKQDTPETSVDASASKAIADVEGQCRKRAYQLAGVAPDGSPGAGATSSTARDLSKLRQPEPDSAVWDGVAWKNGEYTDKQP